MKSILILLILFSFSCSSTSGKKEEDKDLPQKNIVEYYPANTSSLENKIKTVNLTYISWACECANWIEENEYDKFEKQGKLAENSIFI